MWFSGPGGGWTDGAGRRRRRRSLRAPLAVGEQRGPHAELVGTVTVHDELAEQAFDTDVDVLWTEDRHWVHVPAGTTVPAGARSGRRPTTGR